jgi:hypothetical protein
MSEPDALLRRVERTAVLSCALMTMGAAVFAGDHLAAGAGVIAGGTLAAVSYRGIKAGAEILSGAGATGQSPRKNRALGLVKFFTRYGILSAAAYLIMARAHLPPISVIAGASSLVVAITVEAARGTGGRPPGKSWKSSSPNSGSSRR